VQFEFDNFLTANGCFYENRYVGVSIYVGRIIGLGWIQLDLCIYNWSILWKTGDQDHQFSWRFALAL